MDRTPVLSDDDALTEALEAVDDAVAGAVDAIEECVDAAPPVDELVEEAVDGTAVFASATVLGATALAGEAVDGVPRTPEMNRNPAEGMLPGTPLDRVEAVSYLLDESIPIPGTDFRVGLDPILGIVPVAGDAISAAISLYIILEAALAGVSPSKLLLMIGLVGVDAVVGSIPIVGTVFDAVWRANEWNARLMRSDLETGPHR